jgi:hypothetical protein
MSAINSKLAQTAFALLTAGLLATACTDSTAPTDGGLGAGSSKPQLPSGPGSAPAGTRATQQDTSAGSRDTTVASVAVKPSLVVQTSSWSKPEFSGPGVVTMPQRNGVTAMAAGFLRSASVTGIRVYDMPGTYGGIETIAVADVSVWRWNGTSWGAAPYASGRVSARIPQSSYYNSVVLPTATVPLSKSGYYHVTVKVTWVMYGAVLAYKTFSFNSASDYFPFGDAVPGPGYAYLY